MRALLFAAMAKGRSRIEGVLDSPDVEAMIRACEALGATIEQEGETHSVVGVAGAPKTPEGVIDAGNSGIVLRFVGAMAALSTGTTVIGGDTSVCTQRPAQPLLDGLNQLGATAVSRRGNGLAPIAIQGRIEPGSARLSGADSQPVSGLLMATSLLEGTTELTIDDPGEKPWIDVTLEWLARLGHQISHSDYTHYRIEGVGPHAGFEYSVPGDWSSAAYPLIAAKITGSSVTITNVCPDDTQGDKAAMKADSCEIDVNPIIDALPILAVRSCYGSGPVRLYNGAIARKKECDRISAICCELRKMGADIEEFDDGLVIRPAPLRGAEVISHGDHRIAMSLAVAAMGARGETTVRNTACISKSYPEFVQSMQSIGAELCEV